ncbi:MAG: hypothetical protein JXO72_07895 [Vicinamibacteria bacterium]|nr:hypothetical protein [Vicinamibacteria bacterium]
MRGLPVGSIIVLNLHTPKQKVWGLLLDVNAAGVVIRGLDLEVFDDWMRQEARGGEMQIGVTTVFFPLARVERIELDESVGCVIGYAVRYEEIVGRPAGEALKTTDQRVNGDDPDDGGDGA